MSEGSRLGIYLHLVGIVALIAVAVVAGLWLGKKSVRIEPERHAGRPERETAPASAPQTGDSAAPPLFFFARLQPDGGPSAVAEEITMAAAAGIHQYVIPTSLPWEGDMQASLGPLDLLTQLDPDCRALLYVKLDPPAAWLAAHPEHVYRPGDKDPGQPCMASEVWRQDTKTILEAFVSAARTSYPDRILGYVIACLESGRWHCPGGRDASEANTAAFRGWLGRAYKEDQALQYAWGDPDAALDTAAVPQKPDDAETGPVFFALPAMQRQIDFLAFTSETVAETIAAFAAHIKGIAGEDAKVLAPYGYTYELTANDAGHFALARLLESEVDGFISPVSYYDRGLGGVGGMMGPVDSVLAHGKQWYLIDDTRTGIARDAATGKIARLKNLRADDVYHVQQRNFAAALTRGLGLIWSDPDGDGRLHDPAIWQRFGAMWHTYQAVRGPAEVEENQGQAFGEAPVLAVVVDEMNRLYLGREERLNELLLNQVRDCALRAGTPTGFYLLSDVLDGRAPKASAYLFLNAFRLTAGQRRRLHALLEESRAAALWMYAPGYIDEDADVANIAATTRMAVKAFDGPAQAGSACLLSGNWVAENDEFGSPRQWQPLFYIDDPNVDVIARYRTSGKPSVGVAFFQEGWASIFCAEPGLSPGFLREMLGILELQPCFQETPERFTDATYFGPNLIAVHAKRAGDRLVRLNRIYDIQDLLAPDVGWRRKRSFVVPLKIGETRLLKLTPVEMGAEAG